MDAFDKQQEAFLVIKHFPILAKIITSMPFWLANWLFPDGAGFLEMEQVVSSFSLFVLHRSSSDYRTANARLGI
jgi:hypothetical protein